MFEVVEMIGSGGQRGVQSVLKTFLLKECLNQHACASHSVTQFNFCSGFWAILVIIRGRPYTAQALRLCVSLCDAHIMDIPCRCCEAMRGWREWRPHQQRTLMGGHCPMAQVGIAPSIDCFLPDQCVIALIPFLPSAVGSQFYAFGQSCPYQNIFKSLTGTCCLPMERLLCLPFPKSYEASLLAQQLYQSPLESIVT